MIEVTSTRATVRARIVDVAAALLHDGGSAAVTTRAAAEGAGVQAPTIYRLFGDKDGLLEAVAEHVMATHVAVKSEVLDAAAAHDVGPLEDLRSGWRAQIDFGLGNPAVFRLLSDPERAARSAAARAGRRVLESRVHRIALTGRLRVSEERAVYLIHAAGVGTVQTLLAVPPDQRDPGLADAMYEAVLRQILADVPTRPEDGPRVAAVALRAAAPGLDSLTEAERGLLIEWLDRIVVTPDRLPPTPHNRGEGDHRGKSSRRKVST
jgi:AcrR family transcriptional regulator